MRLDIQTAAMYRASDGSVHPDRKEAALQSAAIELVGILNRAGIETNHNTKIQMKRLLKSPETREVFKALARVK